jgi:hypothetical protein
MGKKLQETRFQFIDKNHNPLPSNFSSPPIEFFALPFLVAAKGGQNQQIVLMLRDSLQADK